MTTHETYSPNNESVADRVEHGLTKTVDSYVTGLDTRNMITAIADDRGIEIPDLMNSVPDEETFFAVANDVLDSRSGKLRSEVKGIPYGSDAKAALEVVKHNIGMTEDAFPKRTRYDAAIIPGGAGKSSRNRLEPVINLVNEGRLTVDMLVMLGSARPIDTEPDEKTGLTELDRAGTGAFNKAGKPADTEAELLRNTVADMLDIPDEAWMTVKGYRPNIPEQYHFQHEYDVYYAQVGSQNVFVISAPMLDEKRHHSDGKRRKEPNTADTLMMTEAMFAPDVRGGKTPDVLMPTDAIYAAYQGAEAAARLAIGGIECETIGFSRASVGMPEWPDSKYAQEILSTFKRTRSARDYLRSAKRAV